MLFVLGGLVRSTGSGMGCPDWPKCFGEYIPPTSESDLPEDYQSYFQKQRIEKTERFAKLLTLVGFKEQANKILEAPKIQEMHQFNVVKAYVEYVNRIWGALTGLVVFIAFLFSFQYFKSNKAVFLFTLLGFISVFINALLGAVVVNTNLFSGLVTIHFLAAFAAIAFFMMARFKISSESFAPQATAKAKVIGLIMLILIVIQTIAGTQVRALYETANYAGTLEIEEINNLGVPFLVHRILAILSVGLALYQWLITRKMQDVTAAYLRINLYVLILVFSQIIIGSLLILTDLQSFSKLFHISIAAGVFVLQFYICGLLLKTIKKEI